MATERVWKYEQDKQIEKLETCVKTFKTLAAKELMESSSIDYEDYKAVREMFDGFDAIVELSRQQAQNQEHVNERMDELKYLIEKMHEDLIKLK